MKPDFSENIGAIILAAGSSSRLGTSKQLITVGGKTLLRHTCEVAHHHTGTNTVVVLGFESGAHELVLADLPIHTIVNDKWQTGMGSSIKAGVKYISEVIPDLDAVIIMVCDQPYVNAEHLGKLIEAYERTRTRLVASAYASTVGVPALFDKSLFQQLLQIEDSHGAKHITQQNSDHLEVIDFPEGAIDIDTREDLQKLAP
jgi:molybdenum cofactor cytidylyltransferase